MDAIGKTAIMRKHTDPIYKCGIFWCDHCEIWGYPKRALWLNKNLILAEFDGCEHTSQWRIVDINLPYDQSRCLATTKKGSRCKNKPIDGFFCNRHVVDHARVPKPHEQ